jgi:hypothetical protein
LERFGQQLRFPSTQGHARSGTPASIAAADLIAPFGNERPSGSVFPCGRRASWLTFRTLGWRVRSDERCIDSAASKA